MSQADIDFLPAVADYYLKKTDIPLERIVFVTPNKRASMFLKRAFCDAIGDKPRMLPRFATMANFIAMHSEKTVASDDEQLFILYNAYLNVVRRHNPDQKMYEFDSFVFWGTMLLNDFNEIEKSLVNAHALFKNLRDLKEIQADYLDDDQKAVIRRIWGDSQLPTGDNEFWKHVKKDTSAKANLGKEFMALWELLSEIYDEFNSLLEQKNLISAGAQERDVLRKFREEGVEYLRRGKHFVFVGHNEVSTAEAFIMERLKAAGAASFIWDTAPLRLFSNSLTGTQPRPMSILKGLVEQFPAPDDFVVPEKETFARIDVRAIPSNMGQTKIAGSVLKAWQEEGLIEKNGQGPDPIRTALILPDADLLVPSLFAIPSEITPVNVAMGIPYRVTTFATFFSSLISMHLRGRFYRGKTHFYYEDVLAVVMHPHVRLFNREASDAINNHINQEKLYNVPAEELIENFPDMAPLFRPVKELKNADAVAKYLIEVFDWVEEGLTNEKNRRLETISDQNNPQPDLENIHIADFEEKTVRYFRNTVERLMFLIRSYNISMKEHTFLHLFERVFAQRGIVASGQPLKGLQVLGVLETRAIDFDNVVITSMNEKIYPKKQYSNTMIPNALRKGYGLPDFDSAELTYAYCFYRIIARSKRLTVLYDARPDGLGGGELSRYVTQVRYLIPNLDIRVDSFAYTTSTHTSESFEIRKDQKVMAALNRMKFDHKGGPSFSASALKAYLNCPLSFFLQYPLGFREPDELVDYKSSADFGTIFHNVIQRLFHSAKNGHITYKVLEDFKNDSDLLHKFAVQELIYFDSNDKSINIEDIDPNSELTPEGQMIVEYVVVNVRNMLEIEMTTIGDGSFDFIASEWNFNPRVVPWKIGDHTINFKMSVDRIDRMDDNTLRLVDFKTGSDEIKVSKLENLFTDDHKSKAIFQLFLYCQALMDNREYASSLGHFTKLKPVISATKIMASTKSWDSITVGKDKVEDYMAFSKDFKTLLEALIREIFDENIPIRQAEDENNCAYCQFKALCGRYPKDRSF